MEGDYKAEFEKLSAEPAETQTTAQDVAEMLELPVGKDVYKIPLTTEVPFKHNGQIQKVPFSQLLNRYRQENHLETKTEELKRLKQEVESSRGDLESFNALQAKYGAIQEWSEKNPEQWEKLWTLFQDREKALSVGDYNPLDGKIQSLEAKLQEAMEFINGSKKSAEESQKEQDLAAVKKDIETFKADFPEINLDEKDEEGVSLKSKIILFGVENDIPEFEAAALKYLKPKLLEVAGLRARKQAVDGIKKDTQQGVISRTSKPSGQGSEVDPRKMNGAEVLERARAEYLESLRG